MPVSYTIDSARGVIFLDASGLVRDEDLLSTMRHVFADVRFSRELRLLGDFTGVTENRLTSSGMSRCAQLNAFSQEARRAVLVKGSAEFGMFRVYEAYCSLNQKSAPQIFQLRPAAIEYLNQGCSPESQLSLDTQASPLPTSLATAVCQPGWEETPSHRVVLLR